MADSGNCPKCEKSISEVQIVGMPLKHGEKAWHGIAYKCPDCDAILSVGFDPFPIIDETANRVLSKLQESSN